MFANTYMAANMSRMIGVAAIGMATTLAGEASAEQPAVPAQSREIYSPPSPTASAYHPELPPVAYNPGLVSSARSSVTGSVPQPDKGLIYGFFSEHTTMTKAQFDFSSGLFLFALSFGAALFVIFKTHKDEDEQTPQRKPKVE